MRGNRRRDTGPEVALRSELHRRGVRFRVDHTIELPGGRVRPDVVFPQKRLAVYVDGCFWHRCPLHGTEPKANSEYWKPKLDANVARDRRANAALREDGWDVLRIWTHVGPVDAADLVEVRLANLETQQRAPSGTAPRPRLRRPI